LRSFIKRCLLFLLVILLLIPIYLYVWGEYSPQLLNSISNIQYYDVGGDFMRLRIQEAKDLRDVEVLVLGSSHAYRGFDPRIFNQHGMKVFNFGSSSQSPIQTEMLLKKYYEKMNPQVVIFEIYPGVFSIDGAEGAIGLLSSDQIDLHSVMMAL